MVVLFIVSRGTSLSMIQIINNLYLHGEAGCCVLNRKYYPVHLRQGDLDGACAVYCVMMYFLILNVVTRRQLEDLYGKVRKKDSIKNLFKALFENKGLIRDGFYYTNLQSIINRHIGESVTAKAHSEESESQTIERIKENIDRGNPIMISAQFSGGAHAMLAIGYEFDDSGIFNIFCLDPGFDCPPTSYWNAVIALNQGSGKKYPHEWIAHHKDYSKNIYLGETLIIDKQ